MANLKRIVVRKAPYETKTVIINIDNVQYVEKIYPKAHYEFGKIIIHMMGLDKPLEFNQGRVNSLRPDSDSCDDWDRFFFDPGTQSIQTEE